jgi:FtsP/CotA-like multicopper oxidase with cupredoxin domain
METFGALGLVTAAGAGVTAVQHGGGGAVQAAPEEHNHSSSSTASAADDEMTVDEMDAMHEAGVLAFPAETAGKGNQPLEFEMDGDVKVFNLTCSAIDWEFLPGQTAEAYAYNGVVPGPQIRVTEGDTVRIHVTNELPESTVVHWHGLRVPNNMDGVPFITQPPIKPGETFTYEFTIKEGNAGSHMYHSHHNSAEQVTKGLLGAFIVDEKDESKRYDVDVDYTMILNDGPIGGYSLNGKSFPATEPIVAKVGQKVLIRFMNEGLMIHPMHLHGFPMQVVALDGYAVPQPHWQDTVNIAPGQRVDCIAEPDEPGVWAFHCHVLSHAETKHGMFGMVTALVVEE